MGGSRRHTRLTRAATFVAGLMLVAAYAVLSGTPANAATTTLWVGTTNCSDGGPGSQANPFCTLKKAASVVTAGQTVLVMSGTYAGGASVTHSGTSSAPIVLSTAPGASVTVSGGPNGFSISGQQWVTITGFSVTGTSSHGIYVAISTNITISANAVANSGFPTQGSNARGIYLAATTSATVTGNTADNNSATGIMLGGGTSGVTVSYNEASRNAEGWRRNANGINVIGPGNTIIGNVVHDNEDSGLQFYPGGDNNLATLNVTYNNGDHGIDDYNVTGGRLVGNTVYHNCTSGINVEGTSGNYLVENNIAVDNAVYPAYNGIACNRRVGNIGVYDSAPSTTTADNNLVWLSAPGTLYFFGSTYNTLAALQQATGQEQHGIQAAPQFANALAWNLQLQEGSPAIDSADSGASGEQPVDVLGASRVDDASVPNTGRGPRVYDDMGAYEFQPSGTAPQPPAAALTVTPSSGPAPLSVTADASASSDPQGQALSYAFDFGDGTTAGPQSTPTAAHSYTAAGSYTVRVTVTDTSSLSATTTQPVTVTPQSQQPSPPVAKLSVTPTSGPAPLSVTADASGSTDPQGQSLSYVFDFGDGTTAGPQSTPTAPHTYATAGSYTVRVTVTDTASLSASASAVVQVTSTSPVAISYVNQIAANYSTSPHTSGSITVWRTGGVRAGDVAVVTVQLTGTSATGPATATDDAGNSYSVASTVADGSGDRLIVLYGLVQQPLAVNQRITVTFPSATTYRITGDEISGVTTADQTASSAGSGTTFASGATPTTTASKEFVFASVALYGGSAPTWSNGWTALPSYAVGSNYLGRAYQLPTTTASFNGTGTGSGAWLSTVVTFR